MRHYGLDAGFTLFILPASKFQHFFFSKEHFKETTPKSLFLCFTLFFFYFLKCSQAYPISFKYTVGFLTSACVRCPVENTAYATCSSSFSFYLALAYE